MALSRMGLVVWFLASCGIEVVMTLEHDIFGN